MPDSVDKVRSKSSKRPLLQGVINAFEYVISGAGNPECLRQNPPAFPGHRCAAAFSPDNAAAPDAAVPDTAVPGAKAQGAETHDAAVLKLSCHQQAMTGCRDGYDGHDGDAGRDLPSDGGRPPGLHAGQIRRRTGRPRHHPF